MKRFTLILSLLMAFCFGVNAQVLKVSEAPVNGDWSENTTWYLIQNKKGGVVSISNTVNTGEYLSLATATIPTTDDANAQWCIVGDETNGYQFYNKASGIDKVLYASRELNSGAASFKMATKGGTENEYFDIENSQQAGYIIVKDHNNQNNYWNYRDANLAYWNSTGARNDDGSSFHFVEAAEYQNAVATAEELLELSEAEYRIVATPIDLKNNTDKLYCNAPCTNTSWGDQFEGHWEYLFDNNHGTILHSEYGGSTSVDGLDHYIRVDMGEGNTIQTLQFTIGTRNKNCTVNSPTTIVVEGCNEPDGTYEEIKTVTGIPQENSYTYTSAPLTNGKAYRYIRYRVTATNSMQKDGGNKVFFFIAEFGMSSVTEEFSVKPEYADYADQIKALSLTLENVNGTILGYTTAVASAVESLDRVIRVDYYALKDKIEELKNTYLAYAGEAIGQYNVSDDFVAAIEAAENVFENSESTASNYQASLATLNALEAPTANITLVDGEFYYIRSAVKENGYVYSKLSDEHADLESDAGTIGFNALAWVSTTTASNQGTWKCEIIEGVAYLKNVHTASYISALHQYKAGVLSETEKAPIVLEALGQGQVRVKVNGLQLHAQANGYAVPWGDGVNSPSAWYIEKASGVQPHTLTVGPAGYATLMLGYNTTIPTIEGEDCGVFTAAINGDWAVMTEIEGVLPANTAVIVKAAPGDYTFTYTTETATVENNDLRGTLYNKNMTEDAYVLGKDENNVAYLGLAIKTDGAWLNNANKAYLVVPAEQAQGVSSYALQFGEGTTGVENVEVENTVKTIYDLTGRRVEEITAPGIYIVNGKKVLVK